MSVGKEARRRMNANRLPASGQATPSASAPEAATQGPHGTGPSSPGPSSPGLSSPGPSSTGRPAGTPPAPGPSRRQRGAQARWTRRTLGYDGAVRALPEWWSTARPAQYPLRRETPDIWLVTGGRGAGKTRLGAEWVQAQVRGLPPFAAPGAGCGRIALVGETLGDVRAVMVEGPSGLLAVARGARPVFEPSRRRLAWPNGAVALMFSSEDPESLRGPQFDAAWCDELGKWKNAEATWDMLQFGLRLGPRPRQIVTTTPRPTRLMRRLMERPDICRTTMPTADNAQNLAPPFLAAMLARYGSTRLGRQELEGEMIADREGALWSRERIEAAALSEPPARLRRIVVAVDPPASARRSSDACGIVAAGLDAAGRVVVLEDASVRAALPADWAARAVALYRRLEADAIVAEVNQGGDMVAAVIRTVDPTAAVKPVRASRGKWLRAEPVAALYAQGRVLHAGRFPALEDEMCDFGPDGLSGGRSPDRVDALVWAVTELTGAGPGTPRIRDLS